MKPMKIFLILLSIIAIFIFTAFFFGDSLLYFMTVSEDKFFGNGNKYIDSTLTGDALLAESNLKDSYKFNNETNDWFLNLFEFFIIILKIFGIIILPLLLYYFTIHKETSILSYLDNLLQKKE